ncbi:nucleoid-associated protein [Xylanibacter muris]|uniref:nucleoid-associated protein n=1 Tax=Xylanibacter muris TaxID=2736290 RepID=UPI0025A014EC|nr:nucleoid-associated protein [Xylanibacter muris]MCX4359336.1 nucleoid-associated protein [Rikenellaceae bacterium]
MDVIFNRFYKIDISTKLATRQISFENGNVTTYVLELLDYISKTNGDREYLFDDTRLTMRTYVDKLISDIDREDTCENIARMLLDIEIDAQQNIQKLGKEIQRGILIISIVQMTDTDMKVIISKSDYTEFIEEITGNKTNGLPTKKRIFKSFVVNINTEDGNNEIVQLLTFDSNASRATYWWKTFLELKEIRDDERNTQTAFNAIKAKILEPIRKKHRPDYLLLWNATIAYFRGEGDFDIDHYKNNIIGNYTPQDKTLKVAELKEKIEKLPSQCKFDPRFTKCPNVIAAKYKNVLRLTDEIDLLIKHDMPNIRKTIQPYSDNEGNKFIMILSSDGYDYALGVKRQHE